MSKSRSGIRFIWPLVMTCMMFAGCAGDSYTSQGIAQGAATGAAAGAVGGMISALIFGGDVVEAGARGAVYGGATGAVAGGISGSRADKAEAARREAELQAEKEAWIRQLKNEIGPDAYNGVEALVDCKHGVAVANAREAQSSGNSNFALAGLWVELLAAAEQKDSSGAARLFPLVIEEDPEINSEQDAQQAVDTVMSELYEIRAEYGLPAQCPA